MNFYLLQLAGKWITLLMVSIATSLGFDSEKAIVEIDNQNADKNINVLAQVSEFKINKTFDSSIPSNITKTIKEGENGVTFYNNLGEVIYSTDAKDEEIVKGTGTYGLYNGIITGYGPDCSTCTGDGYVSCRTLDKKNFSLVTDGIYYEDSEYGKSRILAAALTKFPCGTIIEVQSKTLGTFTGIVLDTGYDMRKGLEDGKYHIDIAYQTEKDEDVHKTTDMSGNTVFSVQRWGW